MKGEKFRQCGQCSRRNIPFGVDWPHWRDGKPTCEQCQKIIDLAALVKSLDDDLAEIKGVKA